MTNLKGYSVLEVKGADMNGSW